MPWNPDEEVQRVINAAKLATPEPGVLSVGTLLAAAVHTSRLAEKFSKLARYLPRPQSLRQDAARQVDINSDVSQVVNALVKRFDTVSLDTFFQALLFSKAGREVLVSAGMPAEELKSLLEEVRPQLDPKLREIVAEPAPPPQQQDVREIGSALRAAIDSILPFGRLITDKDALYASRGGDAELAPAFADLYAAMLRSRWPAVAIVGPIGSGKSKLAFEFCRRIVFGHETLPARLRDLHVFELNVNALRAHDGQRAYETRVQTLFRALAAGKGRLAMFCDDLEALFQGDVPMLNALQRAVSYGEAPIIACARPEEYDKLAAEYPEIFSCFAVVRLRATDRATTLRILQGRRAHVEGTFAPLRIPEALLPHVVDLAEQYLPPVPVEPKRSIDLLDRSCAEAVSRVPPPASLEIEHVHEAIYDQTGRRVGLPPAPITLSADGRPATEQQILDFLRARIIGQDAVLAQIAQRLSASQGPFAPPRRGPLAVFMFAGPTGVGKTETALALAQLRGGPGGKPALIRIDCNTLAGNDYDKTPMIWRLFGVQPGFRGAGEGNLSAIRHYPSSVVLFDELEKASFAIYKILLQMIDDGEVRDSQENLLDFSQAIVVFTTNAGVDYSGQRHMGSIVLKDLAKRAAGAPSSGTAAISADVVDPVASEESVVEAFKQQGYGMEFFGRLQLLVFTPLADADAERVLHKELESMRTSVERLGKTFAWADDVPAALVRRYKSHLGVRYLLRMAQRQIMDQLNIAHARGELAGVRHVRVEIQPDAAPPSATSIGASQRVIEGQTLRIMVS